MRNAALAARPPWRRMSSTSKRTVVDGVHLARNNTVSGSSSVCSIRFLFAGDFRVCRDPPPRTKMVYRFRTLLTPIIRIRDTRNLSGSSAFVARYATVKRATPLSISGSLKWSICTFSSILRRSSADRYPLNVRMFININVTMYTLRVFRLVCVSAHPKYMPAPSLPYFLMANAALKRNCAVMCDLSMITYRC